jgi:hypothetical protein
MYRHCLADQRRAFQAVSRLEAEGWITKLETRLEEDPEAQSAYEEAVRSYAAFRQTLLTEDELKWIEAHRPSWYDVIRESGVGGIHGSSAGLKCLHAHYADYLARGKNPVGKWVYQLLSE